MKQPLASPWRLKHWLFITIKKTNVVREYSFMFIIRNNLWGERPSKLNNKCLRLNVEYSEILETGWCKQKRIALTSRLGVRCRVRKQNDLSSRNGRLRSLKRGRPLTPYQMNLLMGKLKCDQAVCKNSFLVGMEIVQHNAYHGALMTGNHLYTHF